MEEEELLVNDKNEVAIESREDVDDDSLVGLGVIEYDQLELEAIIMKDLDDKAEKESKDQQRKFAKSGLREITDEIKQTTIQLSVISKQIASLLVRPFTSVVTELKIQRTLQKNKKTHLLELEKRRRCLEDCLAKDDFQLMNSSGSSGSHDQQSHDLIKSGLLTPFGTTSTDKVVGVATTSVTDTQKEDTPPSLALAEFDWLGLQEQPTAVKGKGKGPGKLKGSRQRSIDNRKNGNETGSISEHRNDAWNENGTGSISEHRNEAWNGNGTGSERRDETRNDEISNIKRKRKKPRPQTEDEDSDGDMVHVNWPRKGTKRSKGSGRSHDDGDGSLYKERIRQYELSKMDEGDKEPPVEFDGGFKVPSSIWHKLYRYQQTCVKWMWELHCQQAGGIMSDEMGLGKTIQMIAFLAGLKISNLRSHVTRKVGLGPVLIVCPATVLYQWVSEFHKWCPMFRVAVFHDTGSYTGTKPSLLNNITRCDGVIVTTYANIRIYNNLLLRYQWDYLVLDEGHKIRNPDADITLTCKQFATPHKIILSGSPMQNNLRELWSLFDFVFPGKLGTLPVFMEQFSVPITIGGYANASQMQVETAYQCACVLRNTINPYLLRRLKTDVKLQLPNKNEQVLFCRLTDYQRELYQDYIDGPEVQAMMSGRRWIFTGLTKLRKLCNHPDLVTLDYRTINETQPIDSDNNGAESVKDSDNSTYIDTSRIKRSKVVVVRDNEDVYGHYSRSGKMIVVETLLKIWRKQKNKVLLFTQSRGMLKIFESFLTSCNYIFLKMDGTSPISSRQHLIKRFNEDPNIFVFLLTTRVGGLGVNLTGADRVIIFDPDWNPSTDIQARERAWRIGQKKPVTIYRLLTSGTIEEKIYHRQIFKQFLTNRVLRDPRQRRFFKSNNLYELFTLGSSDGTHKTETGAIFAGTGSEVSVKTESHTTKRQKKHKRQNLIEEQGANGCRKKSKVDIHTSDTIELNNNGISHETTGSLPGNESTGSILGNDGLPVNDGLPGNESTGSLLGNDGLPSNETTGSVLGTDGLPGNESTSSLLGNGSLHLLGNDGLPDNQTTGRVPGNGSTSLTDGDSIIECSIDSTNVDDVMINNTTINNDPGPSVVNNTEQIDTDELSIEELLLAFRKMKKKKKKKRRKRQHEAELEGQRIKGLDRMDRYEPGSEDEEDHTMDKQNNIILKQLFKKSGIDTAMQHDTIMSSGDPDYAIVEAEATRIAKSAARALKDSRQRCLGAGTTTTTTWGQPTWTGLHGTMGAPKRRFGNSSQESQQGSHTESGQGTSSLSSSVLLTKMRKRNAHSLPHASSGSGLHSSGHQDLVKRIRDYVALDCKKNGQATTDEILGKFAADLAPSESAVFRSMLHEICDYHRYHGEGVWSLKTAYR